MKSDISTRLEPHVTDLAAHVSGSVLLPQDAGYDAARAVHNGLVDRNPALIVRSRATHDVVAALALPGARDWRSRSAAAGTTSPDGP